jgi:hypothetical protein
MIERLVRWKDWDKGKEKEPLAALILSSTPIKFFNPRDVGFTIYQNYFDRSRRDSRRDVDGDARHQFEDGICIKAIETGGARIWSLRG